MRIGINGTSWHMDRNVTSLPFQHADIVKTHDLFRFVKALYRYSFRSNRFTRPFHFLHQDFGLSTVDLFHFFNDISLTSTPWVVTYEHYLPRWKFHSEWGQSLLARPACRKIIAESGFAFRYLWYRLEEHPRYRDEIRSKMCTVHPAQRALIGEYTEKTLDHNTITFTIVGSDFFKKGGKEILIAAERMVREGYPLHLNIVSTLRYGDYASRSTEPDYREARERIERLKPHVTLIHELPNRQVLDLFKRSHVGLLLSYDETYGYSVLEAQAAGCPVISTDVCALPEINNDDIGWIVSVPRDHHGAAHYKSIEQRNELSSVITESLYNTMKQIYSRPDSIRQKGIRALQRIRTECRPEERVEVLEGLYEEALGGPPVHHRSYFFHTAERQTG